MSPYTFKKHKLDNPQIDFILLKSEFISMECSYDKDYGMYNVFKRDFYNKSNNKTCYVDTFIKEIRVERNKLCPCNNGYSFRIKNNCINDILIENNCI